ncbi:hypothetical protein A3G55_00995 [Candidatus Giovannonibacteria bacterium RIFCSPLOWO2_12_FULL_44_25]|uniref:Type II toxin-antitoxin system HicA family toxin n=1 Tax=Candidatus Giovannonibacteria bacterium RIFCSPHIGHO2_02_FULL_45_40 TaxID=1798337 RepID=A0A1F5WBB7_9BACT|nr:MAG: hypothetical protein A2120_00695 [Candidatus Giovannonibacteria bacterium GWA2_45_15]OGF60406.1 MAG: hypothetical protein A2W40_00075 [Candidatus Giovannonibacteria bacterium RIFCSPHIGHO2_01_45_12]OGF60810.1 MAG: hypothetical protein A2656_03660 [Candidatus Giovannonibacteria bacterium RIFCSPHIGHO2_01_FULL_44_100]OGF72949.1 MAG: hypothetical protein A3C05_02385 [Candidatus Giovannonibacteria bacterium RIFCSPHIGHO2_02_FULL_45_40]OGF84734.1 MAG: hypothetical protein A3A19_02580 [Candidatu
MPKLKVLSGEDVIKILQHFGFSVVKQTGSHVKLQRILDGFKQTLTIANHKELDRGTLRAIYGQVLRYVSEAELKEHFYSNSS